MKRLVMCCLIGVFVGWGQPALAALFVVHYTVGPAWAQGKPFSEQRHARAHSETLARLRESGSIVFGARFGETGMIVVRADSEESVQKMVEQDPAVAEGTFLAQIDAFRPFYTGCIQPPVASNP